MGREVNITYDQLEKEYQHVLQELNEIKELLTLFGYNVSYDVDNITPEDLESYLSGHEIAHYKRFSEVAPQYANSATQIWIAGLVDLCKNLELGYKDHYGFNPFQNLKMFIKSLARENSKLKKMVGAKQIDADSRGDNWDSSDTATD